MSFLNLLNKRKVISLKNLTGQYKKSNLNYKLPIILGENKEGKPEFADLVDLKHILMTGTTGSGKSMFEHTIISTLLSLFTPDKLRLYLVDMKLVELYSYDGLPHLLAPVNPGRNKDGVDKIYRGLEWLIHEKNNRLQLDKAEINKYPYIVVAIDTFSDLIYKNSQKFQSNMSKLMEKAADVKIHVIMSDSRSGDPEAYTPLICGLFPTKICFNVASAEYSREFIGTEGAEKLLGCGDMLFLPHNLKKAIRIQTPYISDKEISSLVKSKVTTVEKI